MKYILCFLTISTLIFSGCSKEEITPLGISDFQVHVGGENKTTAGNVAIDNYITFLDVSRNATEHTWTISDGNSFITDEFTIEDTEFEDFIIPGAGNTSTEEKINVLFQSSGLHTVQIVNKFDKEPTDGPAMATQEGSEWVIDTTYVIDVFANLQPAFKVFKGTEEILSVAAGDIPDVNNQSSWPMVEVETGESLTFVDLTVIGRPNKRNWVFKGATPESSQDSAATVSYFTLGEFKGAEFTSNRDGAFPEQSSNKLVPVKVKVVPSSLPLLYEGNMVELEDELITFNVGGELIPFSDQEGAFTVNVVNDAASYNQNVSVELAQVSASDATKIELKLSEPIFNSDIITVSYSGNGIKSADNRVLSDFGPESVSMFFGESIITSDYSSFEIEHANWKKGFCDGIWVGNPNGSATEPFFARTEDLAADGIACMKLDLYNGIEPKVMQGTDFKNFGLLAGDYLMSMMIYLEPGNIMTTIQTGTEEPLVVTDWDVSSLPRGEWVEISQRESYDADLTKRFDFRVSDTNNPATTEQQVLYFDDFQFRPIEKR